MTLTPANHCILIQPSLVDNDEDQTTSGLHVITHSRPQRKVWRGIVMVVGEHVQEAIEIGEVAHYTDFVEVEGFHIVPEVNLLAWGTRS